MEVCVHLPLYWGNTRENTGTPTDWPSDISRPQSANRRGAWAGPLGGAVTSSDSEKQRMWQAGWDPAY